MDTYAASVDKASEAQERFDAAQKEQADAAEQVADLQKDGTASADELTAAEDPADRGVAGRQRTHAKTLVGIGSGRGRDDEDRLR